MTSSPIYKLSTSTNSKAWSSITETNNTRAKLHVSKLMFKPLRKSMKKVKTLKNSKETTSSNSTSQKKAVQFMKSENFKENSGSSKPIKWSLFIKQSTNQKDKLRPIQSTFSSLSKLKNKTFNTWIFSSKNPTEKAN